MGKTTIWKILCFYPLLPLHNGEKTMRKSCVKLYFGLATFCRGRGGTLNKLFKIPIIFCHWLSEIYKKNEFLCILFQKTQMCFNDPDYLMSHSVMNIMTANGAKMAKKNATIMFLSYYYYLALVRKGLLQAHNDKWCSLLKLLCIYLLLFYPT